MASGDLKATVPQEDQESKKVSVRVISDLLANETTFWWQISCQNGSTKQYIFLSPYKELKLWFNSIVQPRICGVYMHTPCTSTSSYTNIICVCKCLQAKEKVTNLLFFGPCIHFICTPCLWNYFSCCVFQNK